MKTLETSRLILRPLAEGDADFFFDVYSRPQVVRYLGSARTVADRAEAERKLAGWMALDHPVHGIWGIESRQGDALVGVLLLKPIPVSEGEIDTHDIEIGWHLHPDAWGNGFATEAGVAVLKHAFASGIERVIAVTNPENAASRRVAERLGMAYVGKSTHYYDATVSLFEITAK